jgi:beta-xylosidase
MRILKAMLALEGDNSGRVFAADVIEHEGKNWIVPTWHESPAEGYKKPERIVCLDNLPHQKLTQDATQCEFLLTAPVSKAALYGPALLKPAAGYTVIYGPDIRFPIPRGIH